MSRVSSAGSDAGPGAENARAELLLRKAEAFRDEAERRAASIDALREELSQLRAQVDTLTRSAPETEVHQEPAPTLPAAESEERHGLLRFRRRR